MKTKTERLELVAKYFIHTPPKPNYTAEKIWGVAGIILVILSLQTTGLWALLGLISFGVGVVKYLKNKSAYDEEFKRAEPKATDGQMDNWFDEGMRMVEEQARERLDIDLEDTSARPLIIDGPASNTYIGKGKDKMIRFRHHNVIIFFLTEHNVATFQCVLDLGCGEILNDRTKEFPYKDITNLETETTNDTFHYVNDIKSSVTGIQVFNLYTSGANKMSANYIFLKGTSEDFIVPPSTAESTIKAIRKRLKEYKDRFNNYAN